MICMALYIVVDRAPVLQLCVSPEDIMDINHQILNDLIAKILETVSKFST